MDDDLGTICRTWSTQQSERDAVLIVPSFFHDHLGDIRLFIRFSADTRLEDQFEGQDDILTQNRPAGKSVHSEQRWRSLFIFPTLASLLCGRYMEWVWTRTGLVFCGSWCHKELGKTWWLNNKWTMSMLSVSLWNLHSYIRNFFSWPQGFGSCDISIDYHSDD